MGTTTAKLAGVAAVFVAAGVLIGFYVADYLVGNTTPYRPSVQAGATRSVELTMQTVAAVGKLAPHPDWVSYLVRDSSGSWRRTTVCHASGARDRPRDGLQLRRGERSAQPVARADRKGSSATGARRRQAARGRCRPTNPRTRSRYPQLGILVPIAPVGDDAKNQCDYAPCALSNAHRTITFTFRTGKPGHYRWQCFVPCAAGFIYGFGGPMQTIGYMDGFLNVV